MDSYVVHIFRRPGEDSSALVGLVERVGDAERKAFHDQAELIEYLTREPRRSYAGRHRKAAKKA